MYRGFLVLSGFRDAKDENSVYFLAPVAGDSV